MDSVKAALLTCALLYCIVLSTTDPGFKQCPDSPDPVNGEDVRLTQPNCTDDPCTINVQDISTYMGNTPEITGRWKYTTPDYKVYGGNIFLYIYIYIGGKVVESKAVNLYTAYDKDGNELKIPGGFPANTELDLDLWSDLRKNLPSGKGNLTLELEVKPQEKDKKEYKFCVYTDVLVVGKLV